MSKNWQKPIYFDLDGICQLKVYGEPALVRSVSQELAFYQIVNKSLPLTLDLEIELNSLKNFSQSSNPRNMPPYDFFGRYKLARWVLRFERLAQPPHRLKFYGNFFSRMIVAKQIVEPAIRWQAQKLGFIFVHSATLAQNGKGVMVAGPGGSGKTRLLLHWLKRENPFVSDDFTILSYGKARRYVTRLRLGARLLEELGANACVSPKEKIEIYARTALRRALFNYARIQAKIELKKLFPNISLLEQVDLKAVIIIQGQGSNLQKISPEEMSEKLVRLNQEEMYDFVDYLSGLSQRTGETSYADFFQNQQTRLQEILASVPCYQIGSLRELKLKEIENLLNQISELFY